MYIIQSKHDNSFFQGFETLAGLPAEAYTFQIEEAMLFPSWSEAEAVCNSLTDTKTEVLPVYKS